MNAVLSERAVVAYEDQLLAVEEELCPASDLGLELVNSPARRLDRRQPATSKQPIKNLCLGPAPQVQPHRIALTD